MHIQVKTSCLSERVSTEILEWLILRHTNLQIVALAARSVHLQGQVLQLACLPAVSKDDDASVMASWSCSRADQTPRSSISSYWALPYTRGG